MTALTATPTSQPCLVGVLAEVADDRTAALAADALMLAPEDEP